MTAGEQTETADGIPDVLSAEIWRNIADAIERLSVHLNERHRISVYPRGADRVGPRIAVVADPRVLRGNGSGMTSGDGRVLAERRARHIIWSMRQESHCRSATDLYGRLYAMSCCCRMGKTLVRCGGHLPESFLPRHAHETHSGQHIFYTVQA